MRIDTLKLELLASACQWKTGINKNKAGIFPLLLFIHFLSWTMLCPSRLMCISKLEHGLQLNLNNEENEQIIREKKERKIGLLMSNPLEFYLSNISKLYLLVHSPIVKFSLYVLLSLILASFFLDLESTITSQLPAPGVALTFMASYIQPSVS